MPRKTSGLRIAVCVTVLLLVQPLTAQDAGQEVLTNSAIVKMVQAHLGADVIVEQIRNSPGNYSLTANSLIQMKQQGVPDKVIAAMQAKVKYSGASHAMGPSQSNELTQSRPEQLEPTTGSWHVVDVSDPLTDRVTRQAQMVQHGSNGGDFELALSCGSLGRVDQAFAQAVGLDMQPGARLGIKSLTKGLGFHRVESVQPVTSQISPNLHCTWMDVRVGNVVHRGVRSDECANDTAAGLALLGRMGEGTKAIALMSGALDYKENPNYIELADVLQADSMRVRVALTNGEDTYLQIPLDSVFKSSANACIPAAQPGSAASLTGPGPAPAALPSTKGPIPISPTPFDPGHNVDEFTYRPKATRTSRVYTGTADGFASVVPELIQRAAVANGLPAQNYSKETEYIIEAARTCATITPKMAASVQHLGQEAIRSLGEQYKVCNMINVSSVVKGAGDNDHEVTIVMSISPLGHWRDGTGFTISAIFLGVRGDQGVIFFATINGPNSSVGSSRGNLATPRPFHN